MRILDHELELMEPVSATCSETELVVTLANGQKIVTPLWWYPRLRDGTAEQRRTIELSPFGIHWPDLDEDLSLEGMLLGHKAPGAREPQPACATQ
jgi:hypothetical protein